MAHHSTNTSANETDGLALQVMRCSAPAAAGPLPCLLMERRWSGRRWAASGKLIAFTTVHIAPTAMIEAGYDRKNPYCAGIVKLDEGPAISAQILGVDPTKPGEIEIGTPLRAAYVERGEGEEKRTFLAFEV